MLGREKDVVVFYLKAQSGKSKRENRENNEQSNPSTKVLPAPAAPPPSVPAPAAMFAQGPLADRKDLEPRAAPRPGPPVMTSGPHLS